MIDAPRNTCAYRHELFGRLLNAGGRVNKVTAVLIGVRWARWAERVGLWGTGKHQRRQARVEDYEFDLWAGPARPGL